MPKPATFIALPMSIDQSKWHLAYSIMLILKRNMAANARNDLTLLAIRLR